MTKLIGYARISTGTGPPLPGDMGSKEPNRRWAVAFGRPARRAGSPGVGGMPALHRQVIAFRATGEALSASVAAAGSAQHELGGEDFRLRFPSGRGGQEGLQGGLCQVFYGLGDCAEPGPGVFGFG